MKRLLVLLLLIPNLAFAQITQQEVLNAIASNLPTNNANEISALLLRNTLDVMTSAIFQGVPIQTGTACPPLTGLIPFQFFANTTSTTDTTLNLFDGTSCIKWANINQTTHSMGFVGSSLVTAPTSDSFVDITSAGTKTAFDIYSPFSFMGGTEFDVVRGVLDFEGSTLGTVSQANALGGYAYCNFNSQASPYPAKGNCVALSGFAVAANTGANSWGVATFCADNFAPAPYVGGNRSCLNEFDIRIEDTTGTARGTGALFALQGNGTSAGALIAVDIQNFTASLKWNFGVVCENNSVQNACLNIGTQTTGVSGSQALAFDYNFTGNAQKVMIMTTPSTGGFVFTTSDAAINNGFDWSAVTFNQCVLKLASGCTIGANGNITTSLLSDIGSNTSGLTTDFGQLVVQNSATTASGVYSGVNPFLWSDGVRSTVVIPTGTTVGAGTSFGAYLLNQQASAGQTKNGVLYWGQGISAVDNAKTWGFNPGLNDTTNNASTATIGRTLVGIEFDCTLATNNAGSSCQGAQMIIAGLFGEQSGGNAYQAGASFPVSPANAEALAHWTNTFVSPDGITLGQGANQGAALIIGSIVRHTAGTASSQSILFNRWNSGTEVQDRLVDGGTGLLTWSGLAYLGGQYIANAAAVTTAAGQISYGGTTVAAGSGNCPTGTVGTKTVAGCIVMNVAGSTAVVPYF